MPRITGHLSPTLTVTDLERSVAWYRELFGMTVRRAYEPADASQRDACLVEPGTGLELCLVEYAHGARQPFNEFVPGLDHLEFLVAARGDLDDWVARLDALGVAHSGVKEPPYTRNAILTFRDPDNIQLEFFWRAPP
ncbi:MAG TPA: VOC family protein [Acidimicrobiales bacterium]|nr:VOC family protein [Acidimicrobiales bacterium]